LVDAKLIKAKIDITDDMLRKFADADPKGQIIKLFKAVDLWGTLEEGIDEPTQKFHTTMKSLYDLRMDIIAYCERDLKKATQLAEKKSVDEITKFQKYKKRKIAEFEGQGENRGDEDEFGNELRAEL